VSKELSSREPVSRAVPRLILETTGMAAALLALDRATKAAKVSILQAELNDLCGFVLKLEGDLADVILAGEICEEVCRRLRTHCVTTVIANPAPAAEAAAISPAEFQPLLDQEAVYMPKSKPSNNADSQAIGFIETQGFTAVFDAIDTACKAGNVKVLGKEKLGGGYVTVLIQGDVAAVEAAIEAGKERVEGLGTLIAAHVIARPSLEVLRLIS